MLYRYILRILVTPPIPLWLILLNNHRIRENKNNKFDIQSTACLVVIYCIYIHTQYTNVASCFTQTLSIRILQQNLTSGLLDAVHERRKRECVPDNLKVFMWFTSHLPLNEQGPREQNRPQTLQKTMRRLVVQFRLMRGGQQKLVYIDSIYIRAV